MIQRSYSQLGRWPVPSPIEPRCPGSIGLRAGCASTSADLATSRSRRGCSARRGALLVEAAAAVMMLMLAMILTVKLVGWVAQENRSNDRRQQALSEVANVMERLGAIPYEDLTQEAVKQVTLSPQLRATLPDGSLTVDLSENDPVGGNDSKKVSAKIRWKNQSGGWESPVHLTTWIYRSRSK